MTKFAGMKRMLLSVVLLSASWSGAVCQSVDSVFAQMPLEVLPLLERNSRLDMLDLYNYKIQAKAENVFGGSSVLLAKTEDYLRLRLTEVSHWELKCLPLGEDRIYVCVHSLRSGATDSRITLYTSDWKTMEPVTGFDCPPLQDFWQPADSISEERRAELLAKLQPVHVEACWSPDAPELNFSVSVSHLSSEDREDASRCLKPVVRRWNGSEMTEAR